MAPILIQPLRGGKENSNSSRDCLLNRGPWLVEEDEVLRNYIKAHGCHNWSKLPKAAGLLRCRKSCRLRWLNYLRPGLKHGKFSQDEEDLIIQLHSIIGNRWSLIAGRIPGRTDNEIKNFFNFHVSKKLLQMGVNPTTHMPFSSSASPSPFASSSCLPSPLKLYSSPLPSLSLTLPSSPSTSQLSSPSPSFDHDDNSTSSSPSKTQALEFSVTADQQLPSQLINDGDWSFLQELDDFNQLLESLNQITDVS